VLRSHRIAIGLYSLTDGRLTRMKRMEVDIAGVTRAIPDLVGVPRPDLVLVNDDDLSYAKVRLDDHSLRTLVSSIGMFDQSLPATLCWAAAWDMCRDGEMAARDYVRLVLAGVSSVGRGTLEHLELVITDLSRGYSQEPPAEQFVVARAYRSRVDELIRGRHTLKELRELYVYAGCLSELLASLAHDLGNPRAAQASGVDCYLQGEQARHGELCGWAADVMTAIATYAGRPDGAVQAATKGIAQVSPDHPLAIRLRAKAARACARLGDREKFDTLLTEARHLHDQLPTQTPSRFGLDTGTLASYAISAHPAQGYIWLEDFPAAKTYSEAALAAHESVPAGSSSSGKEAIARLNLATALAHLGEPDEAVALGQQALTATCAASFVRAHARDLHTALTTRYPTLTRVRDFSRECVTVFQH